MAEIEILSECSDHSDTKSNISTISGIHYFQYEFVELQHLINPEKCPESSGHYSATTASKDIQDQNDIVPFKAHQKLEETGKDDLELDFNHKINNLILTNKNLEHQLGNANDQIHRLLKSLGKKNTPLFQEKYKLEAKILHLNLENNKLSNHCSTLQLKNGQIELKINKLEANFNDLQANYIRQKSSNQALKDKISEQYLEIKNLTKFNSEVSVSVNSAKIELDRLIKSNDFLQVNFNTSESVRANLREEVEDSRSKIRFFEKQIANLNLELTQCKNKYSELQLIHLREKQVLLKKLENVSENKNNVGSCQINKESSNSHNENFENLYNVSCYQLIIEDLQDEVNKTKCYISEKQVEFDKVKKENSQLVSQCLIQQKKLQENETIIEGLENYKKYILNQLDFYKGNEIRLNRDIAQFKETIRTLEIEIENKNKEKSEVEITINKIRNQFIEIKSAYEKCQTELHDKEQKILQLQNDKQELFMNNNWTICKLEKAMEKDVILDNYKVKITTLYNEISNLTLKLNELNSVLLEKDKDILDKTEEIGRYDSVLNQYKALDEDNKIKIKYLNDSFRDECNASSELNDNLKILQKEIQARDFELNQARDDLKNIKQNLDCSNKDIKEKEQQIFILEENSKKVEGIYKLYLEGNTDDKKAELLKTNNPFNFDHNLLRSLMEKINFDEFQVLTNQKLTKYEEKLTSIKENLLNYLDTDQSKLKTSNDNNENIKKLQILLKYKELEIKEKTKRFETNIRTLLRKLKEHMRGRNVAEKHLNSLQHLYNSIADENNSLKLSLIAKDKEIEITQILSDKYKLSNYNLKINLNDLETKSSGTCEDCFKLDDTRQECLYYQKKCEHLTDNFKKLQKDFADFRNKFSEQVLSSNLKETIIELDHAKESANEKLSALTKDIEQAEKMILELKSDLLHSETEKEALVTEKRFLQRLCNDLKVAMKSYSDQNQSLKEQLTDFSNEKVQFSSLPLMDTIIPASPVLFDDKMVQDILQQHKTSATQISPVNLKECLITLKAEIAGLQNQIANMG